MFKNTAFRSFAAHLLEFGIVFYAVGFIFGWFGQVSATAVVIALLAAFICTAFIAAILYQICGITPCEWLWGIKLEGTPQFSTYFMRRLGVNAESAHFVEYKNSSGKNIFGSILLLIVIAIYFL